MVFLWFSYGFPPFSDDLAGSQHRCARSKSQATFVSDAVARLLSHVKDVAVRAQVEPGVEPGFGHFLGGVLRHFSGKNLVKNSNLGEVKKGRFIELN